MRVAPAPIISSAVSRSRIPPDALTPARWPTVSRMSWTCSTVAPPGLKPVTFLIIGITGILETSTIVPISLTPDPLLKNLNNNGVSLALAFL